MKRLCLLVSIALCGAQLAAPASALPWVSEADNLKMELHQRMFPVTLSYTQQSRFGQVAIDNQTFQDEIAKYELILVNRPDTDPRSALQRMHDYISNLQQSPHVLNLQAEVGIHASLPSVHISWFDGSWTHQEYIFVDGSREYHLRSESFSAEHHDEAQRRLDAMAQSFDLANPRDVTP